MVVSNHYQWKGGAKLEEHSKAKLSILEEYLRQYFLIRGQFPATHLKVAIVDGFSGGGIYECGSFGSPLIFINTVDKVINEINIQRGIDGINNKLSVNLLLICNDMERDAFEAVQEHCAPHIAAINEAENGLTIHTQYRNNRFEDEFQAIFEYLQQEGYKNVLFNLDQYGYSAVLTDTISLICRSFEKPEIFLTFAIETLKTYFSPDEKKNKVPLQDLGIDYNPTELMDGPVSKKEHLGLMEKVVFSTLKNCARFVSPFAIHNPTGWKYWLIHFSNNYRARQAYNNVLHKNKTSQAHYGKIGLDML